MTLIYLWFNAVLYLGLGAWCTLLPEKTSKAIGFGLTNASAKSEYVTVYGGMEVGMGIFFAACALSPALRGPGLLYALILYACLAVFRIGTLVTLENEGTFPKVMLCIEIPMALGALALYMKHG